jgi:hypothetical protein
MERIEIGWFAMAELGADAADALWRRGGFPRAYLARSERDSVAWRKQFIQTLLERDLPQWGVRVPAVALLRFWTMVAHYYGQVWNAAEPARALGVSPWTTRRYLDLLTDAVVLRQLQPWHANLAKPPPGRPPRSAARSTHGAGARRPGSDRLPLEGTGDDQQGVSRHGTEPRPAPRRAALHRRCFEPLLEQRAP